VKILNILMKSVRLVKRMV